MKLFTSLASLINDPSVNNINLIAPSPFSNLEFSREELLALCQGQALISEALSQHFVRRRVFWEHFSAEFPDHALISLKDAELGLDRLSAELISNTDREAVALSKFVRSWAAACAHTRKTLKVRLDRIEAKSNLSPGFGGAWAEYEDVLQKALVSLRRTIYPLLEALIDFLPDDDSTKEEAEQKIREGLDIIHDPTLRRDYEPQWKRARGNSNS